MPAVVVPEHLHHPAVLLDGPDGDPGIQRARAAGRRRRCPKRGRRRAAPPGRSRGAAAVRPSGREHDRQQQRLVGPGVDRRREGQPQQTRLRRGQRTSPRAGAIWVCQQRTTSRKQKTTSGASTPFRARPSGNGLSSQPAAPSQAQSAPRKGRRTRASSQAPAKCHRNSIPRQARSRATRPGKPGRTASSAASSRDGSRWSD